MELKNVGKMKKSTDEQASIKPDIKTGLHSPQKSSPDNTGLEVEKQKNKGVTDAAAEANRDIHQLKNNPPESK